MITEAITTALPQSRNDNGNGNAPNVPTPVVQSPNIPADLTDTRWRTADIGYIDPDLAELEGEEIASLSETTFTGETYTSLPTLYETILAEYVLQLYSRIWLRA